MSIFDHSKSNKGRFGCLVIHIKYCLLCLCLNYSNQILSQQFPIVSQCNLNNICICETLKNSELIEKQVKQILDTVQTHLIKDTALLACCNHQLAIVSYYEDDLLKSLSFNKKAEQLRLKFNDGLLWRSQLNLGINYFDLDEYQFAIDYLLKAYLTDGIKNSFDSLYIYQKLGNCYAYLGDLEKGIEYGRSAVKIKGDIDVEDLNHAKNDLAKILIETNLPERIELGIDYLEQILNSSTDQDNIVLALIELANANVLSEKYDQALKYYKKGLSISKHDTINLCIILNNIGTLYMDSDPLEWASIDTLKKALNLYQSYYKTNFNYDYAAPLENLADNYTALNQFATALLHYQKALIHLTNNFRTEDIYQNPNPKDNDLYIYSNPDIIRVLHLKANAAYQYYQQNNNIKYLELASQTYRAAFDFHDKLQQDISTENSRLFQAKNIVPYIENALKVAYELQEKGYDIEEPTFRFMGKNKATVLLQAMNEADALQFANLPDSLTEQEKELKIAITYHNKQLNEAVEYEETREIDRLNGLLFEEKKLYSQLINNLENNYPNYHRLKYEQNQISLIGIQQNLDDQMALIEYFVGDSSIYISSILKNRIQLYKVKKPNNWKKTIDELRQSIAEVYNNDKVTFATNARQLGQLLLDPVLCDLSENITRLQIIPDAELNYIPFEVLLTEDVDEYNIQYKNLNYLLKNKSIGYAYSAALWLENKQSSSLTKTVTYGGYAPKYFGEVYHDLPNGRATVAVLANSLNGLSFTNQQADLFNFLNDKNSYNILHLVTHGILNDKNPLSSYMAFSPANNYKLYAYDLYNMKINSDLTILQACDTGYGELQKGEGVMSLSRAFTYAGCPSLVMSLWQIPEVETSEITKLFIEYLKNGLPKDVALKQAKLNYLENDSIPERVTTPAFWAGLVATGNLNALDF